MLEFLSRPLEHNPPATTTDLIVCGIWMVLVVTAALLTRRRWGPPLEKLLKRKVEELRGPRGDKRL